MLKGDTQIEVGVVPVGKSLTWDRNVNFVVTGELTFVPTIDKKAEIAAANKIREDGLAATREQQRLVQEAFVKAAKERVELAAGIKPRPSWDLREEERTVVYRQLIKRLMLDTWKLPDTEETRRISHVRSEIVRSLFDVDSMLYFVAPEWWMPRKHHGQFVGKSPVFHTLGKKAVSTPPLGNEVIVNRSDNEVRPDNYYISDKSEPAKQGSSLARSTSRDTGSPTGREAQGDGAAVVVGGRESRPHGEGPQVLGRPKGKEAAMASAETVSATYADPAEGSADRALESRMRSKDSCLVWGGGAGKVPRSGNSPPPYSTLSPVL